MERRTHYIVLGISRAESPSGIRAAYRDLAKRLHPDVAGRESTRAFQELTEAYDVLSDPKRRSAYDEILKISEGGPKAPARPRRAEPLVREPFSIFTHPESIRPSHEDLHSRYLRNFTRGRAPKSERIESLTVEVVLTPEEAFAGCIVPVALPVFGPCPSCGGSGRDWIYPCASCRAQGLIEAEKLVQVEIPPLVRSGSVFEVPLSGLGVHNFVLRLHVFVGA